MSSSFFNTNQLKHRRRNLRRASTSAELALWKYLRNRQLYGRKFRRQYSIGNYILDFYCAEERIAIELDGEVHHNDVIYKKDIFREKFLQDQNINVLRFENKLVFENLEFVLESIKKYFKN